MSRWYICLVSKSAAVRVSEVFSRVVITHLDPSTPKTGVFCVNSTNVQFSLF